MFDEDPLKPLDHESLDAYQVSMDFAVYADELLTTMPKEVAHMTDQLRRASTSISLNIAEGCGRSGVSDRARFFKIARGSAMESAAALDFLLRTKRISFEGFVRGQMMVRRIVPMLVGLIKHAEKKK